MEFVFRRHKAFSGKTGNLFGNKLRKALRRIKPRSDSRSAERQLVKRFNRHFQKLRVTLKACAPARNFLAELNRRCVLQMRSARFNDSLVLRFKALKGFNQHFNRRKQLILNRRNRGNVHRRGERVVRGLAHVNIIVRMAKL